LKLLLQPAMRLLERIRVPRTLSAFLLILVLLGIVIALGAAVSGPAADWAGRLPHGLPRLQERLQFLARPIQVTQNFLHQLDGDQANSPNLGITAMLFSGTQHLAGGLFETLLVLFFLLVSGDTFLRRMVEVVPRFSDKRQVVALSKQIESNISAYLVTITGMNLLVGIAAACMAWGTSLGDPVFWGVVAFLLNYVPIIGPFAGVMIFGLAGMLVRDDLLYALLPAGFYLLIHLIEGEFVTPMLLARRFTLNPVVVIISLIFWFWMWGVPGAILAVPMLAIVKIVCDGVLPLNAFGHFLEG
jgi:predicted PurR-regulated permease PerM